MDNAFTAFTAPFQAGAGGFCIRFDNGHEVSVVWDADPSGRHGNGVTTAEVGIFSETNLDGDIRGWQTPVQVVEILNEVSRRQR